MNGGMWMVTLAISYSILKPHVHDSDLHGVGGAVQNRNAEGAGQGPRS
jgi:hypothetical protein